jgi:hypothetical protein
MRVSALSLVFLVFLVPSAYGQSSSGAIRQDEVDYQNQCYKRWWNSELNWKFDELPTKGVVSAGRLPYAGFIYPDGNGGTMSAMRKYDRAFHRGRSLAASYEQRDIEVHKEEQRVGLFRLRVRYETPNWHGHCNGWVAAAIRHAEPQKSVTRNGVVFTPSDIKGLLAELYIYSDTEFLGGIDPAINPATMHVVLANWLGMGSYPIGMDTTVGEEVWNYPIYSYAYAATKRSERVVDVNMNIAYVDATNREYDKAPRTRKYKRFHYRLNLDREGNIVGGRYYGDSSRIDMLWAPLQPAQGGQEGNESGNPHLDVKTVLAIWRDSVPEEVRRRYPNIDPTDEDRMPELDEESPLTIAQAETSEQPSEAPVEEAAVEEVAEETDDSNTEAESADTAAEGTSTDAPALAAPNNTGDEPGTENGHEQGAVVAERPGT